MNPVVHMSMSLLPGTGHSFDDLNLRALRSAGFKTNDIVFVARTKANKQWLRRNAPGAEAVFLPFSEALHTCPIVGSTVRPALGRASEGIGLAATDMIYGDRWLRRRPADVVMSFMNLTAERLEPYVSAPTLVIAELGVASELVLAGLAAAHGGVPVWPRTLRYPSDRFALYTVPRGVHMVQRPRGAGDVTIAQADEWLRDAVAGVSAPSYYTANNEAEGVRLVVNTALNRMNDFRADGRSNLQLPRLRDYLELPWLNVLAGRRNSAAYAKRSWDDIPATPFAVFPLHVQPEISVDVLAPEWRDQAHAACELADALAVHGVALAVKEHQNFIWRRDLSFWDALDRHPNIFAVDPSSDMRSLIDRAEFIFTPTGTAGLEAAIRGSKVVMGSRMPWTSLPNVAAVETIGAMSDFVAERGWESLHSDDAELRRWWHGSYLANSFPGVPLDPPRWPGVLDPANVERIGAAYAEAAAMVTARAKE